MANPWFRMYHEFATDPKVQMLSEQDQRRYVMALCLRCGNGDKNISDEQMSFQLRITSDEWTETKATLMEKGLVDNDNQPTQWDKRQYVADTQPRSSNSSSYVYFVGTSSLSVGISVVKIGISKNPWARLAELQTGNPEKLQVVATVKTDRSSEVEIHDILKDARVNGEWFRYTELLDLLLAKIENKSIKNYDDLLYYASTHRSNQVATTVATTTEQLRRATTTTTDTEADTDTEDKNTPSSKDDSTPYSEAFETFWKLYPRKVGKGAAFKAFQKNKLGNGKLQKVLDAVESQSKSEQWTRDNGQFIPHPTTWINGGRWDDEAESGREAAKDPYTSPIYQ